MVFGGFTSIGTAQASVVIDLSQARQSVAEMRTIATQLTQSINQATRSATQSTGQPNQFGVITNLNRQMQEEARAAQQLARQRQQAIASASKQPTTIPEWDDMQRAERDARQKVVAEIRLTQRVLAEERARLAQQQQRFNVAASNAPSGTDRRGAIGALAGSRQDISDAQARLASLQRQIEGLSPRQQMALIPQLRQLREEAQQAASGGLQRLNAQITAFEANVSRSRSGVQGYFTMVRENLERINETSLAANLQEISFRLLPLGLATGAALRQGVQASQQLQEIQLSMTAFTGSEAAAVSLMQQLTEQAHRFGLPMLETLNVMQRFAPLIREAGLDLNDTIDIAARLATLNPTQGVEGALYAINEALVGQWRSLAFRFNIPVAELRGLIEQQGFIGGMDEFLNRLGRTTEFAEAFGETTRASFTKLTDSINNLLSSALAPFIDTLTNAIDSVTAFFNSLASTSPLITGLVGGFLLLTTTMTTMLITLGQVALGLNAIKALLPQTAAAAAAASATITTANTAAAASGAAAGGGGLVAGAGALVGRFAPVVARGALVTGSVLGGVAVGTNVAAGLGIPGIENPADAIQRLVQIISLPVALLAQALETIVNVVKNASELLATAFSNIGTGISAGAGLIGDVLQRLGSVITDTIGNIQIAIGTALRGIADWVEQNFPAVDTGGLGLAALNLQRSGMEAKLSVAGILTQPILSYAERTRDQFKNLAEMPLLPTQEQQDEAARHAATRWVEFNNTLSSILGFLGFPTAVVPLPSGEPEPTGAGGLTGAGGTSGLGEDELERAYELLVNRMIQTTRQAQDEQIASLREAQDFAISRSRAVADYFRQQQQQIEDFTRERAQRVDDFNRQMADEEEQALEERRDNLKDYQDEEARRQADHLRDMIRAARDVDSAISARNFLAAQQALQKIRDSEEDFRTETDRRRDDFEEQQQDLEDNLKEQQDKRREDFERQQRLQDENFARQQQRQQEEFRLRLSREDQDRQLRQFREEQDRQIRRSREEQDFQIQIASLSSHNSTMQFIWRYGLGVLQSLTQDFWNQIAQQPAAQLPPPAYVPDPGAYDFYGMTAAQTAQAFNATAQGYNYAAGIYPAGFTGTPFADGGYVTRSGLALLHAPEVILRPAGRSPLGAMGLGSGGISITVDARGSSMSREEWISAAEDVIIPKMISELERRQKKVF